MAAIENVNDFNIPEGWEMNRRLRDLLASEGSDIVTDPQFLNTLAVAHLEVVDSVARIYDELNKLINVLRGLSGAALLRPINPAK
jgi:hypothetical protein